MVPGLEVSLSEVPKLTSLKLHPSEQSEHQMLMLFNSQIFICFPLLCFCSVGSETAFQFTLKGNKHNYQICSHSNLNEQSPL